MRSNATFSFTFVFLCTLIIIAVRLGDVQCLVDVDQAISEFLFKHTQNGTNLTAWEAPEYMKKELVYYFSGFDDENRPTHFNSSINWKWVILVLRRDDMCLHRRFWVAEWGKWDAKKYLEAGGEKYQNFSMYLDQQAVRMLQSIKLRSTPEDPVDEVVFIIDLENLPLEQITSPGGLLFVLQKTASYAAVAQAMDKGFIINTNFVGDRILNLVKPNLGATFARFEIYGTNKEKWIPKLLKHIPRTELPEWYGGIKDFKPIKVHGK